MKKGLFILLALSFGLFITACKEEADEANLGWNATQTFAYSDIATWDGMETPVEGSGTGSVSETNTTDEFVTIQAASDGWGGLQSPSITLDLSTNPYIFAQIYESPDGSNWGMKFVPDNAGESGEWGYYLIEDNSMKWNKYAGVDVRDALGEDFVTLYGEEVTGKLWIFAAGGPTATVSVSQIVVVDELTADLSFSYSDIASWDGMQTPVEGSGTGSVIETNDTEDFVTIQAASDGWGGLQSVQVTLDLAKNPFLFAQIYESPDGSNWGMKFVPDNVDETGEWGYYLFEDNSYKWNKYAGVDVRAALGEDFIALYGEEVTGTLWIFAAGGPTATVSVSQLLVVNTSK
jgi:hypothetical protein